MKGTNDAVSWRIRPYLKYYSKLTVRILGKNPNFQNYPNMIPSFKNFRFFFFKITKGGEETKRLEYDFFTMMRIKLSFACN